MCQKVLSFSRGDKNMTSCNYVVLLQLSRYLKITLFRMTFRFVTTDRNVKFALVAKLTVLLLIIIFPLGNPLVREFAKTPFLILFISSNVYDAQIFRVWLYIE